MRPVLTFNVSPLGKVLVVQLVTAPPEDNNWKLAGEFLEPLNICPVVTTGGGYIVLIVIATGPKLVPSVIAATEKVNTDGVAAAVPDITPAEVFNENCPVVPDTNAH